MADSNPELSRILDLLKDNPRGMSVKQIASAIGMNRISIARYLDVLRTAGQVDMEPYGQAKVYYLTRRVPINNLINLSSEAVISIDASMRIIEANKTFLNIFSYGPDEIRGIQVEEIFNRGGCDVRVSSRISAALTGEEVAEEIRLFRDDREQYFQMRITPTVLTDGSPAITIILEDITEQKHSRGALLEKEEKYKVLLNNANDSIFLNLIDNEGLPGRFIEVNDIACERLGFRRDEILKRTLKEITPEKSWKQMTDVLEKLFREEHVTFEGEHLASTGQSIPVEISAHIFTMNNRWVVLSIARDITERKEMQRLEREAYRQIEKNMEQLATLTNKIRNPLSVIVGYEDLLPSQASEKILEQATIINDILTQLDCGWLESQEVRDFLKRRLGLYEETGR